MDDPRILEPIPTPTVQRWREVRLLYLPRAVFVLGVIVAAIMWSSYVTPATLVAEASLMHAEVRATQPGVIVGMKVELLHPVRANQVIGHVAPTNLPVLEATLAVIRAEVGTLTASMSGGTNKQSGTLEFEKMQLDWMNRRVDLALLEGSVQQAEADLASAERLFKQGIGTEQRVTQLKSTLETLAKQVAERSRLVAQLEPTIRSHAPLGEKDAGLMAKSALEAAIEVQDAKLRLAEEQLKPVPLVAPMDGVVSQKLRHEGEAVTAGETIVRISAAQADRLTGFLRQPLSFDPKPGMIVELRSRKASRQVAMSKILQVGPAMEPIFPTLLSALRLPEKPAPEPGLRVEIAMPRGFDLRPGEFVDVMVR